MFVMITQAKIKSVIIFHFLMYYFVYFITEYVFTNPVWSKFRVLFLVTYKGNYGNLCTK